MTTAAPAIPGLSYRVRIEESRRSPDAEVDDLVEHFDYLRVRADSVEHALTKVEAHHRQVRSLPAQHDGHDRVLVWPLLLGYNIDDRAVPSPETLISFADHGGGWQWEIQFYGSDEEPARYRTDRRGRGLWRWMPGAADWMQYKDDSFSMPAEQDEARDWLTRRWGLADQRVIADTDDVTADQVLTILAEHGRPITERTLRNYSSRPPTGWPAPTKRIGRTPIWSRTAIVAYANARH